MKLKKSEKILLAVAASVLVVGGIWTIAGSGKKSAGPSPGKTAAKRVADNIETGIKNVQSIIKPDSASAVKVRYDSWGRDPFRDLYAKNPEEEEIISNLTVKGIIRRGSHKFVMINDIILAEGEEKDGLYIERIDDNQVFCRKSGKWFTLTWKEEP
ncbi:hypothetical protein JW835_07405 [bacterium]|nr:hypothetical protein [bacterium]